MVRWERVGEVGVSIATGKGIEDAVSAASPLAGAKGQNGRSGSRASHQPASSDNHQLIT